MVRFLKIKRMLSILLFPYNGAQFTSPYIVALSRYLLIHHHYYETN